MMKLNGYNCPGCFDLQKELDILNEKYLKCVRDLAIKSIIKQPKVRKSKRIKNMTKKKYPLSKTIFKK